MVIQLGLSKIFMIFKRLSNFAFNPFAFDPKIENFTEEFFTFFFPFFLLFFDFFSFCFFGSNLGVDFAMGLFGMQRDFAKVQALLAMDLVGV